MDFKNLISKLKINRLRFCAVIFLAFFSERIFAQCPPGTYTVSGHPRTEYYRNDGTHFSATFVSEHCRGFTNTGTLTIKFEDSMPERWPYKNEQFKKWSNKEKNLIENILNSLPKKLTQIGDLRILRALKSQNKINPATSAPTEKIIVFYDDVFRENPKKIITHELAHIVYEQLSDKEKEAYWQAAGWIKDTNNSFKVPQKEFAAPDGSSDPDEDFANDVELFLYAPTKLKKMNLNSHECINKLLKD